MPDARDRRSRARGSARLRTTSLRSRRAAESCTLVAVTVTLVCEAIGGGGVYNSEELTLPVRGLIDHVTAVLLAFVTVPANCCVPEPASLRDKFFQATSRLFRPDRRQVKA